MAESKTLAELVQDLPAELYNNVLEYTLTIDEDEVVIDKNWKPHARLQINRATRAHVAKKFYQDTEFTDWDEVGSLLPLFFGTLSEEHASMITKIRLGDCVLFEQGTGRGDYLIELFTQLGRESDARRELWELEAQLGCSKLRAPLERVGHA